MVLTPESLDLHSSSDGFQSGSDLGLPVLRLWGVDPKLSDLSHSSLWGVSSLGYGYALSPARTAGGSWASADTREGEREQGRHDSATLSPEA